MGEGRRKELAGFTPIFPKSITNSKVLATVQYRPPYWIRTFIQVRLLVGSYIVWHNNIRLLVTLNNEKESQI